MQTLSTQVLKRHFRCRFVHKRFHSDNLPPIGEVNVSKGKSLHFGPWEFYSDEYELLPEYLISCHREVIKGHIQSFLDDPLYCYLWDEESGWETYITEVL